MDETKLNPRILNLKKILKKKKTKTQPTTINNNNHPTKIIAFYLLEMCPISYKPS
jgi:hypothetical protein